MCVHTHTKILSIHRDLDGQKIYQVAIYSPGSRNCLYLAGISQGCHKTFCMACIEIFKISEDPDAWLFKYIYIFMYICIYTYRYIHIHLYVCLYIYWAGAVWESSLVQLNSKLFVFISLPAVLLPIITQCYTARCPEPAGANTDPASCHIQFSLLTRPWSTTETVRKIHHLGHNCGIN